MTKEELLAALEKMQACPEATAWVKRHAGIDPRDGNVLLQRLWEDCTMPEWMLWYLEIRISGRFQDRVEFLARFMKMMRDKYGVGLQFASELATDYLMDFHVWLNQQPTSPKDIPRLPDYHRVFREIEKSEEEDHNEAMVATWATLCFLYGYAINGNTEEPEDDHEFAMEDFEQHFAGEIVQLDWFAGLDQSPIDVDDVRKIYPQVIWPEE